MSSNYFFKKWKNTLAKLDYLLEIDFLYQETNAHDSNICEASERLSGVLAQYIVVCNEAFDCLIHNTQVQKIKYITDVVKAIISRVLELKHALRKLDGGSYQFLSNGAASNKLTTYDVEFHNIVKVERAEHVQTMIDEILKQVKEKKELLKLQETKPVEPEKIVNWWEIDEEQESDNGASYDSGEKLAEETEEILKTREMLNLIKAHEKFRQFVTYQNHTNLKREMWIKQLEGTLHPPAPLALRERAAKFIQKACRAYFDLKRKKIQEGKRDQLLGIRHCYPQEDTTNCKADEISYNRVQLRKKYTDEWISSCEKLKEDYIKRNGDDFKEHYRDLIRAWFEQWFNEIQFFHDIPNDAEGGLLPIIKEELPLPTEWIEEYNRYLEEKKANKGKTALQLKWAEREAKAAKMMAKREEMLKKKQEAEMQKRLKKNPTMHPGYDYPKSKKTHIILEVLENYHKSWDDLDFSECIYVKEKFVPKLIYENAYMQAKMEIARTVTEDMREELKTLRRALKADYINNGEIIPEPMKRTSKKSRKKIKRLKLISNEKIAEKMHSLAMKDIFKEYPKTKMEDFLGDHNFAGADIRCNYAQALPFGGETRSIWWERCRDMARGFNQILIVGPKGSGKTILIHIYCTLNDAVLFELDLLSLLNEMSAPYLEQLMTTVVTCAKAVQPSVIYMKHVHLFYNKDPNEEADLDLIKMKKIVKKQCKRIIKTDKITVIGTCIDPWLTKAKPMLRQFPTVVLVPDTAYSAVVKILTDWIAKNPTVPRDLDVQSLAFVLRGFSFGYLKQCLVDFLSSDRIIKIASEGLKPQDLYNYILDDGKEIKVKYDRYLKWYFEKTHVGQREKKHLEEQREFKMMLDLYLERMEKAQKKQKDVKNN